jgi:hypothetical protein
MNRSNSCVAMVIAMLATFPSIVMAQAGHRVHLHVSDRWEECAFQLHPSLTQEAWHQFAREAGLVTYFRPLRDAAPMGARKFEISVVQSLIGIDHQDAAWNDTFVHPDSTHWLYEGSGLPVPGLMARAGVTDRLDVGAFFTMNPRSNYGFAGGQVQYNVVQQSSAGVDASVRASMVSLFGPSDLDVTVYGLDLVTSRRFPLFARASLAPYVGVSGYLSSAREKSSVVDLRDEHVAGVHALVGVVARVSVLQVAVEYDAARVQSRTMRVGVGF